MKLYITPLSPYARFARIVVFEKGLEDRVDILPAQTRVTNSPYYSINPSGRVPYLIRDDGIGISPSSERASGSGLQIMHYRARVVGGTLDIDAEPAQGTAIRIRLPLESEAT